MERSVCFSLSFIDPHFSNFMASLAYDWIIFIPESNSMFYLIIFTIFGRNYHYLNLHRVQARRTMIKTNIHITKGISKSIKICNFTITKIEFIRIEFYSYIKFITLLKNLQILSWSHNIALCNSTSFHKITKIQWNHFFKLDIRVTHIPFLLKVLQEFQNTQKPSPLEVKFHSSTSSSLFQMSHNPIKKTKYNQ